MKKLLLALLLLGFAHASFGQDKAELDQRIQRVTAKLLTMQTKPDKAIPYDSLNKAEGIILLERAKGGLVFGYEDGKGVAMVRNPRTRRWSAAAFMKSGSASFGLQAGGEQSFYVILLMTTNATHLMTQPTADFGGEARGTAGDAHAGADSTASPDDRPILIYDDRNGFYGGAVVKGGKLKPDEKANAAYYGEYLTVSDILFDKKAKPTDTAKELAGKLNEFSQKAKN